MPIQSFGIEHHIPNLKLDVFPIPGQPIPQPQSGSPDVNKDHFMAMACLASLRIKDTKKKGHVVAINKLNSIILFMNVLCVQLLI